jgi:hypothetical protein
METYLLSIAVFAVLVLLALMWLLLVRMRPGNSSPPDIANNDDTIVLKGDEAPFASVAQLLHTDKITNISTIVVATLAAQKAFVSIHSDGLQDRARDKFSIGYIGGYVGEVLRRKHMEWTHTARTIEQVVFEGIFGSLDGGHLYERFRSLRQSSDADVAAGMAAGTSDIKEWLRNDLNIPFGWSVYVCDRPDTE